MHVLGIGYQTLLRLPMGLLLSWWPVLAFLARVRLSRFPAYVSDRRCLYCHHVSL